MNELDRPWLATWIQPRHLCEQSLDAYRRTCATHPARLFTLESFLAPAVADRLTRFLESEAIFRQVYGLASRGSYEVSESEWLAAKPDDRFARYHVMDSVKPEFRLGANLLAYLKLRRAWSDRRMAAFFEQLCGLPLGALHSYVHAMMPGDYLWPHDDALDTRRLAYVLFLTRTWDLASGGVLTVAAGDNAWHIEPQYNTLVVFDVTAHDQHSVGEIAGDRGDLLRLTWGGWIADAGNP